MEKNIHAVELGKLSGGGKTPSQKMASSHNLAKARKKAQINAKLNGYPNLKKARKKRWVK